MRLARLHFEGGNYGEAITAADEVLQRDPADLSAKSIRAVSGLRVATRSLEDIQQDQTLAGAARPDARRLAMLLRATLGEDVLVPPVVVVEPPPEPEVRNLCANAVRRAGQRDRPRPRPRQPHSLLRRGQSLRCSAIGGPPSTQPTETPCPERQCSEAIAARPAARCNSLTTSRWAMPSSRRNCRSWSGWSAISRVSLQPQAKVRDRKFVGLDLDNFDDVMAGVAPRAAFRVKNRLSEADGELAVDLTFEAFEDFRPEAVVSRSNRCAN